VLWCEVIPAKCLSPSTEPNLQRAKGDHSNAINTLIGCRPVRCRAVHPSRTAPPPQGPSRIDSRVRIGRRRTISADGGISAAGYPPSFQPPARLFSPLLPPSVASLSDRGCGFYIQFYDVRRVPNSRRCSLRTEDPELAKLYRRRIERLCMSGAYDLDQFASSIHVVTAPGSLFSIGGGSLRGSARDVSRKPSSARS